MPFTDKQISALRPRPTRYERMESGRTGLGMRVTPTGVKTWTFRYRFDGNQRRMVFGTYPAMGVAKAHMALAEARETLRAGTDPGAVVAEARSVERNAETVADLVAEYIERHAKPNMKPATAAEDERMLNRDVIPHLGRRKAKDITRRDLIVILDGIEDRGAPVARNRVAGVLSRMFRFAIDRGIVDASPAFGIRHLDEGRGRDRFLSPDEIRSLWIGIDGMGSSPPMRVAIKFALATGQRRAEVAGTERSDIDDAEAVWRLPVVTTKNGRENIIPLPPFIISLVAEADRHRVKPPPKRLNRMDRTPYDPEPSPWLFPSARGRKPLEPGALTRALNRNREILKIGDATIHDLRRTFATHLGELGIAPETIRVLLNHAAPDLTGRVYNRSLNLDARRLAMEAWCAWLAKVISGESAVDETVVPLRSG